MIYRDYGVTGKKVSLLGFGGMRFANIDNTDECIRTMIKAAEGGVNYFDTAPGYFETKSETVFGKALAEMRRKNLPYYVATKTFKSTNDAIRREIEAQLKRLDVDAIDFYHIWSIITLENWDARKKEGILTTFRKLKEEGLIRHICVSSHLIQDKIETLLKEGVFEGVLFGYSALNFKTREKAFDAIRAKKLGAVAMNPLGGGLIPGHPELFGFIMRPGESVVEAALRFLWDHRDLSVALVGFRGEQDLAEALSAMEKYQPRTEAELAAVKEKAGDSLEGLCTGCAYCDDCPQDIPIPYYMDAYNHKLLKDYGNSDLKDRLNWQWNLVPKDAGKCTECGQCEKTCTQHLPIVERLKYIKGI
ncbi:MAG: aldo/keto reductase [Treponema sp.]|jgi:predicted aldo/keto reductase-like oxidoreductase|nr:aldo/keto reductase [Treponema sp.]